MQICKWSLYLKHSKEEKMGEVWGGGGLGGGERKGVTVRLSIIPNGVSNTTGIEQQSICFAAIEMFLIF